MQLLTDFLHAKKHHAQKTGLKEKRGEHFIGHQRPDHRTGLVGKHRPIRSKLVGHHNARDDAHRESHGENLAPEFKQIQIN